MPSRAYRARWVAAAAFVAAAGVACGRGGGGGGRDEPASAAAVVVMDAGIDARVWTEADVASVPYHSAAEIGADGVNAEGKLAVVRLSSQGLRRADITAFPCEEKAWPVQKFFVTFTPTTVDMIRALPGRVARGGECPRVLVRVRSIGSTGFSGYAAADGSWQTREDEARVVTADLLAVFDVAPRAKVPPPPGADYATLTDAMLGPEEGGGAVVSVQLRRSSYGGSAVGLYACDERDFGGPVWFNSEALGGELGLMAGCRTVTFRTRARGSIDWGDSMSAELIRIEPLPGPAMAPDAGAKP
jgi:hypothetical protein